MQIPSIWNQRRTYGGEPVLIRQMLFPDWDFGRSRVWFRSWWSGLGKSSEIVADAGMPSCPGIGRVWYGMVRSGVELVPDT
jgi:hypothetical protein